MIKLKQKNGITLVALVITIVVLLILAGISIQAITGTGLFDKAKQAAQESKYANAAEKVALAVNASYDETGKINDDYLKENVNKIDGLNKKVETVTYDLKILVDGFEFTISEYGKITGEKKEVATLPDNTKDTDAGTNVKLPSEWGTQAVSYIKTTDGTEVTTLETVATVYAVSDGNNNTVPIPNGFYYVGGNINSGVVISDDERDKNKFAGQADVPAGAIYNSDGTVKTENLSSEEQAQTLFGNQFVWIPCMASNYVKIDWGKANATWEKQTNIAELSQIEKYNGFYIGRYEAGTSNIKLSTGVNFASQNTADNSWQNSKFSIRDGLNQTVTGKITQKAGEIPYYHADYETSLKLSVSMYKTEYVHSGLVTGTMWDVMMKFIAGDDDTIVTSSSWGNYNNENITYTAGKGRYSVVNSSTGETAAFIKMDGSYHYGIKTTAISEDVKKKNLYDVAGNLWEYTQEASYPNNTVESYMLRGGSFVQISSSYPACYRGYRSANGSSTNGGFRPALYIK